MCTTEQRSILGAHSTWILLLHRTQTRMDTRAWHTCCTYMRRVASTAIAAMQDNGAKEAGAEEATARVAEEQRQSGLTMPMLTHKTFDSSCTHYMTVHTRSITMRHQCLLGNILWHPCTCNNICSADNDHYNRVRASRRLQSWRQPQCRRQRSSARQWAWTHAYRHVYKMCINLCLGMCA